MYSIYSLIDGAIEDDLTADTLDEAYALYEGIVNAEIARKEQAEPGTYAETTVHLYNASEAVMSMVAEYCITRN